MLRATLKQSLVVCLLASLSTRRFVALLGRGTSIVRQTSLQPHQHAPAALLCLAAHPPHTSVLGRCRAAQQCTAVKYESFTSVRARDVILICSICHALAAIDYIRSRCSGLIGSVRHTAVCRVCRVSPCSTQIHIKL